MEITLWRAGALMVETDILQHGGPLPVVAIVALTILFNGAFFFVTGGVVHWWHHRRGRGAAPAWKHQPASFQSRGQITSKIPLAVTNSIIISIGIGIAVAHVLDGQTARAWGMSDWPAWYVLISTAALFVWYHVTLYYVHRTMHRPALFRRIHHVHHASRAPMFLDALYEHPLEAIVGALVLATPVFLFPVWPPAYFAFVVIVGLHEIIDHAGVKTDLPLPFLSRSLDHDDHHRYSSVCYGQLLGVLDRIHGTGAKR